MNIVFKVYGPCNQRCPYCVDLMKGPSREIVYREFSSDIFEKFESALIKVNDSLPFNFRCVYHLVGGEPSFWPIDVQYRFISIMEKYNKYWTVPTNAYDINAPILNRHSWWYNVHLTGPFKGLNSGVNYTTSVIEDSRQEKGYWEKWGVKPFRVIPDQTVTDLSDGSAQKVVVASESQTLCIIRGLRTIQIDVPSQKWTPCCHDYNYLDMKDFSLLVHPKCPKECIPPTEYK